MKNYPEFLVFLYILIFSSPLYGQTSTKNLSPTEWQTVFIDKTMQKHLSLLSNTEQPEQWRDWIMLALAKQIAPNDNGKTAFSNLYDFPILRNEELNQLQNWQYGEKRQIFINDGESYVLVPDKSPKQLIYLARAADEHRLVKGQKPLALHLVHYQLLDGSASFRISSSVSSAELFSTSYGYVEATVLNRNELMDFLAKTDDLVYAQKNTGGSLTLGGRRFQSVKTANVSVEDIAAIYQADHRLEQEYRERVKRQLQQQYEEVIEDNARSISVSYLQKNINESNFVNIDYNKTLKQWGTNYRTSSLGNFSHGIPITPSFLVPKMKLAYPYQAFEDDHISSYQADRDFNIGFSLDPDLQKSRFSSELKRLVSNDTAFINKWLKNNMIPGWKEDYFREMDQFSKLFGKFSTDNGYTVSHDEDLEIKESSLSTLINGANFQKIEHEDKAKSPDPVNTLLESLQDEEKIILESYIQKQLQEIKKAIKTNSKVLLYMAQCIEQDNTLPFFYLKAYYRGERDLEELEEIMPANIQAILENKEDAENGALTQFIEKLYQSNQYQKARYDGDFKGTQVGMTLFYTDLIMKLWSFNYKSSAPEKDVVGFLSEVNHPISSNYYNDLNENPSTRSWLGLLESSYDLSNNGSRMFFKHCATKIFNASSNNLRPGEEVAANYASERFATWWNNHYSEVADYEEEYHHLNQIMKWSQICHWLKQDGLWPFLSNERVTRNLDFETWYPNNRKLKVQVPIPFIPRNLLKERTECISILESEPYMAFTNAEFLLYHLSGGVSLGVKRNIKIRAEANKIRESLGIQAKGFTRPTIDGKKSLDKVGGFSFTKFNNTKIEVNPVKLSASFSNPTSKLRGLTAEINPVAVITRNVEQNVNSLSLIDKSIKSNQDVFKIQVATPNRIQLSLEASDLSRTKNFIGSLERGNPTQQLWDHSEVEKLLIVRKTALGEPEEYFLKLADNKNWLKVISSNFPRSTADVRFSRSSFGGKPTYQNMNFIPESEVDASSRVFTYRRIGTNPGENKVTEFSNSLPLNPERYRITQGNISDEVIIASDAIYIPNKSPNVKALSNLVQNNARSIEEATNNMRINKSQIGIIKDDLGNTFNLGSRNATPEELRMLNEVASKTNSKINFIVIDETNQGGVKLIGDNVLMIPKKASPIEIEAINFFTERVGQNKNWANVLKEINSSSLTNEDLGILKSIHPDNVEFGSTYFNMKSVQLLDDEGLANFRFAANHPQIILKDNLGIRVIDISNGNSMSHALATVRKSTNVKKLVTLEPEGESDLPLAILSKMEKHSSPGGDIMFIKDQANLVRSMDNSREDVYPDLSQTVYLTTIKLIHPAYPQISKAQQRVDSLEFKDTLAACTADLFYDYLVDEEVKQMVVVLRANDEGLIFADGLISYEELAIWLEDIENPKDMIYIISNHANRIQKIISDSGKSTLTIASQFTLGKPESLANCLNYLAEFYLRTHYKANIKINKWKALVKVHPGLEKIVQKHTRSFVAKGEEVSVPVGKFTQTEIKSLPTKIWDKLVKVTGTFNNRKMPAESRTIQSIINTLQSQKIEEMRPRLQQNIDHFNLKAIPNFKVEIRSKLELFWCYDKHNGLCFNALC